VIATLLDLVESMISSATDSSGFLFRAEEDIGQFDFSVFLSAQLRLIDLIAIHSFASRAPDACDRDKFRQMLVSWRVGRGLGVGRAINVSRRIRIHPVQSGMTRTFRQAGNAASTISDVGPKKRPPAKPDGPFYT
jgi:hypothetical protein